MEGSDVFCFNSFICCHSKQTELIGFSVGSCEADGSELTREEVLGSQVADAQAEDGQFVQTGGDFLGEGQQTGQPLQLAVQTVPVPFGRVGFGPFGWGRLHPDHHHRIREASASSGTFRR